MLSEKLKQFRADKQALEDKKAALLAQLKDDEQALDKLELEIVAEVLSLKKTQKVEGVTVSYRKGTKKVDYEAAAKALKVPVKAYQSVKTDFTAAVKAAKLDPEMLKPFSTTGRPSVSIKLED